MAGSVAVIVFPSPASISASPPSQHGSAAYQLLTMMPQAKMPT